MTFAVEVHVRSWHKVAVRGIIANVAFGLDSEGPTSDGNARIGALSVDPNGVAALPLSI